MMQRRRPAWPSVVTARGLSSARGVLGSPLARHSALNLAGSIVPIVVAIPCLAVMPRFLDAEGFSLILLAWALVGYAGIFDLGVSRAVVLLVAREPAEGPARREILATALIIALVSGCLGAIALSSALPWLISDVIRTSPPHRADAITGFGLVAWSIPLLLPYLVVQGYWDGCERFGEANVQRVVGGSLPLVLATIAVTIQPTFTAAAVGIVSGRALSFLFCLTRGTDVRRALTPALFRAARARTLLGFGGWVTLSGAISPLMGYLDRYILSYARGAAVVAFYAAPSELVLKLLVLPVAITRSLYPKLAATAGDAAAARAVLGHAYLLVFAVCLPLCVVLAAAAPFMLDLWLGDAFRTASTPVLQVLIAGFFLSALAQVPFTQLHAKGRADLAARLHLAEAIVFVPAAWLAASRYGPVGSAAAWSLRNAVDLLVLQVMGRRATWR